MDFAQETKPPQQMFLELVRQCKHYLLWQREQGWDGIPSDPANTTWGQQHEDAISKMLLTAPQTSVPQKTKLPPGSAMLTPSGTSSTAKSGSEEGGNPLFQHAFSSLGGSALGEQGSPREVSNASRTSLWQGEESPSSFGKELSIPAHEEPLSLDVMDVGMETWEQEPSLPLSLLHTVSASEQQHRQKALEELYRGCRGCNRCERVQGCTQVVVGTGSPLARVMLMDEGPDSQQDQTGQWWVGEKGQLLQQILSAVGLVPDEIYLTSMVRCLSGNPATPKQQEIEACFPWLQQEIEIIRPDFIITLGAVATQFLLQKTTALGRLRGQWHHMGLFPKIPVFPTFSPEYLLSPPVLSSRRCPKKDAWQDWLVVRERLLQERAGKN